jgi:hypothetical protein
MISRFLPALVFLAACGAGGVCAGCGGAGDDDVDAMPDHFRVTTVSADLSCDGSPSAVQVEIVGAKTDEPRFPGAPAGWDVCEPAADAGAAWSIRCYKNSAPTTAYFEVTLAKTLDGGSVTRSFLDCTTTAPAATVEIL